MATYAEAREAAERDDARMTPAQRLELATWLQGQGLPGNVTLARLHNAPDSLGRAQKVWIADFRKRVVLEAGFAALDRVAAKLTR